MKALQSIHHAIKKYLLRSFVIFTATVLFFTNFVADKNLQLFHFTCSIGTLLIQIVYGGIIVLAETQYFRKTAKMIWWSGLINLVLACVGFFFLKFPIPEFWVKYNGEMLQIWQQVEVVFMLMLAYISSAFAMLYTAGILHIFFRRRLLLLRVALVATIGVSVDIFVLTPIILFISPDSYTAWWKVLSLLSVKFSLCFYVIPLSAFLVFILKSSFFAPPLPDKWRGAKQN